MAPLSISCQVVVCLFLLCFFSFNDHFFLSPEGCHFGSTSALISDPVL